MVNIERLSSFSAITKEKWNTLLDASRERYIFQRYEFQSQWWKHFGEKREKNKLLLLLAKEGGAVIGIAPLFEEKIRLFNKPVIKFIGTPISDYMDFIILKDREQEVLRYFYNYIKRLKYFEMDLMFIPEESTILKSEVAKTIQIDACPYINLENSWEATYNRLNTTVKKYVLRRERNISKIGSLEFGTVRNVNEIDNFLREYFRLHIMRWKYLGKRYSQFQYAHWRDFVRKLCYEFLPEGFIDLSFLKLNSEMIACHFGFIYNKTFHWYMATFNPAYSEYSPGHLFTMYLLKNSCYLKLHIFDFLRGTEPHKMFWTNKTKNLYNCLGYNDDFVLNTTGRIIRKSKDFYFKLIKPQLRKVNPLMKLWYRAKVGDIQRNDGR